MAEEVGFEPTEACTSAVFKTAALNHSATLPLIWFYTPNNAPSIGTEQGIVIASILSFKGDNHVNDWACWASKLIKRDERRAVL